MTIGFAEESEANTGAFESVGRHQQRVLGRDAAQNEVRVRVFGLQERSSGFDGRVRGLHRDLRGREVAPDEDVQVRNLGERRVHVWYLLAFS